MPVTRRPRAAKKKSGVARSHPASSTGLVTWSAAATNAGWVADLPSGCLQRKSSQKPTLADGWFSNDSLFCIFFYPLFLIYQLSRRFDARAPVISCSSFKERTSQYQWDRTRRRLLSAQFCRRNPGMNIARNSLRRKLYGRWERNPSPKSSERCRGLRKAKHFRYITPLRV